MSDNVHALPGYSVPSFEPVKKVVDILTEALELAKSGKAIGCAIVLVERDPMMFVTEVHGEQMSRHTLAAGVLALAHMVGHQLNE